jgi:dihydroorotate dehydrogenase
MLRRMDPERAHRLAITALRLGLAGQNAAPDDPSLAITAFGRAFRNPLGLAAGFDKDAKALRGLRQLGFGFVEVGTVTPNPQPGNPPPRLFRLPEDQAVINRMGFNNGGAASMRRRLQAPPRGHPVPAGVNIGINKDGADPDRDYPALLAALAPVADYVVMNVSSPNTPGLRDLQSEHRLRTILTAMQEAVPNRPPLLVKLAPDLSDAGLEGVLAACLETGVDGLILTNTTLARPGSLRSAFAQQSGGLSGRPLFERSTAMLRRAHALAQGRLVLIGAGGVEDGETALAKIRAGARLVQIYTSFALQGPAIVQRIKRELAEALRRDGFACVADAVGAAT